MQELNGIKDGINSIIDAENEKKASEIITENNLKINNLGM